VPFSPEIARANVLAEQGAFDPAITFRRSYSEGGHADHRGPLVGTLTKIDDYALSFGGLTPWGMTYNFSATADNQRGATNRFTNNFLTFGGITVTQPLLRGFGFGATLAGLRVAKADRGIADWQHRQTVIDTVTNVVLVYSSVIQAREVVRIAQFSRSLSVQLLEQNEKRNRIGQFSDADVLQARARVPARDEIVLAAERNANDLENQLRQLVGETVYPVNAPPIDLEPLPPVPPFSVEAAEDLKHAYDLRPDYQAARLGIVRRRATHALAQNQLLPRVDFFGSYGYNGLDPDFSTARAQVRNQDFRSYSAGLVVSVPITFAEGRGRARAARLSVQQSRPTSFGWSRTSRSMSPLRPARSRRPDSGWSPPAPRCSWLNNISRPSSRNSMLARARRFSSSRRRTSSRRRKTATLAPSPTSAVRSQTTSVKSAPRWRIGTSSSSRRELFWGR
jgi:outer membrane protein TolC